MDRRSLVTAPDPVAPPCVRTASLLALRAWTVVVLAVLGWHGGVAPAVTVDVVAGAYLAVGAGLTVLCHSGRRRLRQAAFAVGLVADALFLGLRHDQLSGPGTASSVHVVVAAFAVAVCLLGSLRAGLALTALLSVLPWVVGAPGGRSLADLVALWAAVVTAAAAAWVPLREARRRRRDAEGLRGLATGLHRDTTRRAVAERVVEFGAEHLGAPRAAVVDQRGDHLELLAGHGTSQVPSAVPGASPLLALAALADRPTRHRPPDPRREPWLTAVLPRARHLVVARLDVGLEERTWLVLEPPGRRPAIAGRRVPAVLDQVVATSALALARVRLLAETTARASRDPLTGVANRRTLDELIDQLTARHRRSGDGFAVVMADVDRFKAINDTLGHATGDEVLQQVAAVLRAELRADESLARYGGEEFAVVLPGADTAAAAALAERLRLALHSITHPVPVTASFGVAAVPGDAATGTTATALADAALLRAKQEGRDRVAVAAPAVGALARPVGG